MRHSHPQNPKPHIRWDWISWDSKPSVADPGFSPGGCANSQKCYYFSIFFPKTAWKWKNLDPQGGARPWRRPLDPPMAMFGHTCHWRIQDFPERRQLRKWDYFANFLPKTAWKWKNFDLGLHLWRPLDPPMFLMVMSIYFHPLVWEIYMCK